MTESYLAPTPDRPAVTIRRSRRRRRTLSARRDGDGILVMVPWGMDPREERRGVEDLVGKVLARRRRSHRGDDDLARRARTLAHTYLDPHAGHPVRPTSVRWVTNQNQRWGSCTATTGEIRLSDRMRAFPGWVVDYVLLHELCHLVHADHGPAFRALVARHPRAQEAEGFLRGWSWAQGDAERDGEEPTDDPGDW